jgi:hypothetical protein
MKLPVLLIAALTLSACGAKTARVEQPLRNGDTFETATNRPSMEEEVTIVRIYDLHGNLRSQQISTDDTVGGDVARATIPVATGAAINAAGAIVVADRKVDAAEAHEGDNIQWNIQGGQGGNAASQAVSDVGVTSTNTSGAPVGACGPSGNLCNSGL